MTSQSNNRLPVVESLIIPVIAQLLDSEEDTEPVCTSGDDVIYSKG